MITAPPYGPNQSHDAEKVVAAHIKSLWLGGIFKSLIGRGRAQFEQAIITFMRSDAFLGSKWSPRELHFFLSETQGGKSYDKEHFLTNPDLELSIRKALASLQQKGLVKKHTVPLQGWLGSPSETKYSLVDAEVNSLNRVVQASIFHRLATGLCVAR